MKLALAAMIALLTLESARAEQLSAPLQNQAKYYIATVKIGTPATEYKLLVDTGTSNTWIGANTPYVPTSSSNKTPNSFSVSDGGKKEASGNEWIDTVDLGNDLVVKAQSIGVANKPTGFSGVDGVLGLGPVDLTKGTLSPDETSTIPTVLDNLASQRTIPAALYGVSFQPATSMSEVNGEITFGGVDQSKFVGDITYVAITTTSPANNHWGIDASFTYGAKEILSSAAGIVDSATTRLLLASDAFHKFQDATGATLDPATGFLSITPDHYHSMNSLFIHIGGTAFELTVNALTWPRSLNSEIKGSSDQIYLIVGDLGSPSGGGLDFILGCKVMERIYTVFDSAKQQVGFAETPFTRYITN
ncbi:MAG: acid protease [Linnemannia gamsii]|nr:MAG: acid protease [Linnemannia gamsii]